MKLRAAGSGLVLLGWIAASHLGSTGRGPMDLHVAVAVAPLVLAVFVVAARWRSLLLKLLLALACAGLLWGLWPLLRQQVAFLYYLQHLGVHLALAALFGASLMGGAEPLVTRMARGIFGPDLSPRNLRYTRQVTWAWTVFFLLNASVSTGLFLLAPREVWSVHANVLTGPLLGLMFLLESLWRRCVLPPHERPGLATVVQAWRRDHERRRGAHRP
ncbi:hypothetical protein [Hydrogenophaga sp. T2]|uniref:COG4648 family protein n=1 Tax=Hydrogenophaga sp. T2 TaxID=3132823 RepID=UPI003CEAA76A